MKRTEIYTDGTYSRNNPDWDEADAIYKVNWLHQLLTRNKLSFQSVTEIGCGSGKVLKLLSETLPGSIQFSGYDISPQAIQYAKKNNGENIRVFHGDFLDPSTPGADLIIMFDVVEHVADYYQFLEGLKNKGSYFAFHIPLDLCCRTLLKPHVMLQQRDAVGHIHYFSRDMVIWMLQDTGYVVLDWMYTKPIGDIANAATFKGWLKKNLRNLSFSINKNRSADVWGGYSMMILAR